MALVPAGRSFSAEPNRLHWGEKDAPLDHEAAGLPGGRELLPRERFGPAEMLRWLEETQDSNG